jgi:hypothetical protein
MQQTILSKKALHFNYKKYKEATRSLRDIEEPVPSSDRTIRDKETGLSDQVQVKTGFLPQRREMRCAFNSSYSYLQVCFIHLLILVISMFHTGNTNFYGCFKFIHISISVSCISGPTLTLKTFLLYKNVLVKFTASLTKRST